MPEHLTFQAQLTVTSVSCCDVCRQSCNLWTIRAGCWHAESHVSKKIHWISNYVVHSLVSRFVLGSVRSACEHLQKWQAVNNQASAKLTVTDPPLVARNLLRLCPTGPEFRSHGLCLSSELGLALLHIYTG